MKRIVFLTLLAWGCCVATSFAQKVKRVKVTYQYPMGMNESIEQAKRTALYRAKVKAIADEFGTIVSMNEINVAEERDGNVTDYFYMMSMDEVRGEWLETIGEPIYKKEILGDDIFWTVTVEGRVRELVSSGTEFTAAVLRNGTDLKCKSTDFSDGDDMFLYFSSPVDGYLAVYLQDEMGKMVYCLLPYKDSGEGACKIKHDKPYILFSKKNREDGWCNVDEYTLTCEKPEEFNVLYVVYSPNNFTKAFSSADGSGKPRVLPLKQFNDWLFACRNKDKEMRVEKISITIKNRKL